ncbi:MAG: lipopolysaccharide/colanic/teichoic acid biosynthesis glycosyltransferase [Flavobacteriaceae bacterium]|jgi:lipopolysaccharide/colanic/teichoic acid biosynthesis glycosyltransferase
MLTKKQQVIKRFFDVVMSILLLPFLLAPLIILIIIATLRTKQSGVFIQKRIGKEGKPFSFYKIRSLKGSNHQDINDIAMRQTNFGKWLRSTKLDELPQLFNVINGTMSWVGPRPDIPGYADQLKGEDQIILSVKPGITGPATIKYKNEDLLLLQQNEPLIYNDTVIWPDKVAINKLYVKHWRLINDIRYLWKSVFE